MSDTVPRENQEDAGFRPIAEMLGALRFLTRLPIPFAKTVDPVPLAQAMRAFPLAGALIGAANGLAFEAFVHLRIPHLMAAALALGFNVMITGALHEDGVADTADGLFGGQTRERRLEIMRDSRIGSYGAAALILVFLMRAGAYEALLAQPFWHVLGILAGTGAFSRTMVVDLMWATRPARSEGLSVLAGRPGRNTALFAIVAGGFFAVLGGWGVAPISGVIAMGVAVLITGGLRRLATRLLGGQTGDICGAVQVLAELGMLASYLARVY